MTKDEFITQFNDIISAQAPDALKIEEFRANVSNDYDALATAQTAVTSFTETNKKLSETNKALQETNMKLIMLHPESINLPNSNSSADSSSDDEPKELTPEEKDKALSEVLAGFGHKTT